MTAKDDRKQPGGQQGEPKGADKQQQQQTGEGQQYGEGNYKATRQYNEGLKEHVENHDIEREARDAEPRTAAEEKDMQDAERFARGKSRGEGASPDGEQGEKKPR
jgi:hypothetical protein